MAAAPRFHRVAAGDYETADGQFRLWKLLDVNPAAWNVEYGSDWISARIDEDPEHVTAWDYGDLVVDGAASKRDALALFAEWWEARDDG